MSHNFGTTTNFSVDTTDSFWSGLSATQQTNVTANANYLLGQVETAFATTTSWFGTDTSKFGTSHRPEVLLDLTDGSGANNTGYGSAPAIAFGYTSRASETISAPASLFTQRLRRRSCLTGHRRAFLPKI